MADSPDTLAAAAAPLVAARQGLSVANLYAMKELAPCTPPGAFAVYDLLNGYCRGERGRSWVAVPQALKKGRFADRGERHDGHEGIQVLDPHRR